MRTGIWRFAVRVVGVLLILFPVSVLAASIQTKGEQHPVAPKRDGSYQSAQLVFCVPPTVWSSRRGRCVNPFVKSRPTCRSPRVWSSKQRRCVFPVVEDDRCGRRELWDTGRDECVCRGGYERSGDDCVRVARDDDSGPDYAEIQSCLNELGYNAGRVDGQPGQRTRRAWNEFRADNKLGGRIRTFDHPETLGKLFKDCDADRSKEKDGVAAKTGDKPDADDSDSSDQEDKPAEAEVADTAKQDDDTATQSAAQTDSGEQDQDDAADAAPEGYAELLCVSKGLQEAMSKVVGPGTKMGLCGDACIPIPPGMTAAQLKKSEQEYSVKWCRNCIRLGNAGIICGKTN